jgi:pilus assembly protein Flp/PilA
LAALFHYRPLPGSAYFSLVAIAAHSHGRKSRADMLTQSRIFGSEKSGNHVLLDRGELRTIPEGPICRRPPRFNDALDRHAFRCDPHRSYPMSKIVQFMKNESGATAIEYGLIAAGISVAIIAVVNTLGSQLNAKFTSISTQLQ